MMPAKTRAIDTSEAPRLLKLLTEGFPAHSAAQWERRFETWWGKNPCLKTGMPIGWVLEDAESDIVGFMGSIPVRFLVNGKPGIAVAASSWYVKPDYRGVHSLSFPLAFLRQKTPGLFLSTTPTDTVKHILRRLKFSSLAFPFQGKEYWMVLRPEGILSQVRLKYFRTKLQNRLLTAAAIPLKLIWNSLHLLKNKRLTGHRADRYHCSLATTCDDSFTELWEKTARRKTTTLYRDAETLNWLLSSRFPEGSRYLIECKSRDDGRMKGYMIIDLDDPAGSESRVMQMKDLFLPVFDEDALLTMIAYAAALAKEKGASFLKLWAANPECDRVLRKHMPLRKTATFSYIYKFNLTTDSQPGPDHMFIPSLIDPDRGLI